MPDLMSFNLDHERLDEGSAEERATFGLLRVSANEQLLTEGFDAFIDDRRAGPLVAGCHLAEWLLTNWWRLRYEPRPAGKPSRSWRMAHCMAEIGEGFVWPNITVISDGFRSVIQSELTIDRASTFRFQGSSLPVLLPWLEVERAIDAYADKVVALLRKRDLMETNVELLRRDLNRERSEPACERFRKLEALMGFDPDEVEEEQINSLIAEDSRFGESGVDELAAASGGSVDFLQADRIEGIAREFGVSARIDATPPAEGLPAWGSVEAWRIGVEGARWLRSELRLGDGPLNNVTLTSLFETRPDVLEFHAQSRTDLSFALADGASGSRIALRGKHPTARRFDFARLLGDHTIRSASQFVPATRSFSYRQQAQRAFAAEFLAPIEAVVAMAEDDFSPESQSDIASEYMVSSWTIESLLKNNHYLPRDSSDLGYRP